MAAAADLEALEALTCWDSEDFRADLALLQESTAEASRRYAADVLVLARLVARVPRCAFDERGATPWTSFRREVAVARSISDPAAAAQIRAAQRLTSVLPRTLELLGQGRLTVARAQAFVREVETFSDELAGRLDAAVADKLPSLSVPRIVQAVRRAALLLDPDSAALRTAVKNAARGVSLLPDQDDQAAVTIFGPAVPLTRWYATLDQRARALKQAGDPRPLDALRFDLATGTYPCAVHTPPDPTDPSESTESTAADDVSGRVQPGVQQDAATAQDVVLAAAGARPSFVEAASSDCRRSRPAQALVGIPVETTLGLSNDPAWLDGYGWLSAPTARQLLVDAELRQVCLHSGTGALVDLADRDVRPPPTPDGVRQALLDMVLGDITVGELATRTEPQHDPSPPLRELIALRDRYCDGPTGATVPARRAQLDHDDPWPTGPTAAWNLVARSTRTHQLKHYGWTPLKTPTSTLWASPSGQLVDVPRPVEPPPGIDTDQDGRPATLPDPQVLAAVDQQQLTPPQDDQTPPWFTTRDTTNWTWLPHDEVDPIPF